MGTLTTVRPKNFVNMTMMEFIASVFSFFFFFFYYPEHEPVSESLKQSHGSIILYLIAALVPVVIYN